MQETGEPVQIASFDLGTLLNRTLMVQVLLFFISYEQGAWLRKEDKGGGVAATQLKRLCLNTIVCTRSCAGKQNRFLL